MTNSSTCELCGCEPHCDEICLKCSDGGIVCENCECEKCNGE